MKSQNQALIDANKTLQKEKQDASDQIQAMKNQHERDQKELEENRKKLESANINVKIFRGIKTALEKKIEFKDITINTLKASNQSLAAEKESREIELAKLRVDYEKILKSDEEKSESILKMHGKWNGLFSDFDPSVVRVLKKDIKQVKQYKMETIAKYSTLSLVGRSKYELVRKVIQIPMPCYTTLQNIRSSIKVRPGYIPFSFEVLQEKVKSLKGIDLECVLSFDETSIF